MNVSAVPNDRRPKDLVLVKDLLASLLLLVRHLLLVAMHLLLVASCNY